MNGFTNLGGFPLITGLLSLFIAAGCDDNNGGGDNPFPPPNSLATLVAERGGIAPDGSLLFRTIEDGFQGPNDSGLAFFRATLMNADRTSTPNNIGIFLAQ